MRKFNPIQFQSQEAILRGRLYLPEDNSKSHPIIIMAHGFATTINGMTADKYAEKFQKSKFAVLLYDHRNFGVSDGEPRQEINFWMQSRGYIDCIDFVSSLSKIDAKQLAVWGASLSAREAFLVGTLDDRIKAIITMVPAFGDEFPKKDKDGSLYYFAKTIIFKERIMDLPQIVSKQMPIVSYNQLETPSALTEITAYRWFTEYGGRSRTKWKNNVSFSNTETPQLFHIGQFAPYLKAPILMIVATNDEMEGANSEVTEEVFKMIIKPKKIVKVDGGHFGLLYYPSSIFDKSSQAQIDFLNRYLKQGNVLQHGQ